MVAKLPAGQHLVEINSGTANTDGVDKETTAIIVVSDGKKHRRNVRDRLTPDLVFATTTYKSGVLAGVIECTADGRLTVKSGSFTIFLSDSTGTSGSL